MIPFGFTIKACELQKTLGYNPWTSLWSHPVGYHGYLKAKTLPKPCTGVMAPQS